MVNKKYVINLSVPLNDEIRTQFAREGIKVYFFDELIPEHIVIETEKELDFVAGLSFVRNVRETRTGRLLKNASTFSLKMFPSIEEDVKLLHQRNYYGFGVKIAVLDAGINREMFSHISDVKDFTGYGVEPITEHGNIVLSIIKKFAKASNIYSGKICHYEDKLKEEDLLAGLKWAKEMQVNVINISAGINYNCDGSCILAHYINALVDKCNIAVVVSVGNTGDSTPYCPGCAERAIVVGSLSEDGNSVADFSTPGSIHLNKPNMVAPGYGNILLPEGQRLRFCGTSFSAPVITGIIGTLVLNFSPLSKLITSIYTATESLDGVSSKKQGLGKLSLPKLMEVLENAKEIHSTGTGA